MKLSVIERAQIDFLQELCKRKDRFMSDTELGRLKGLQEKELHNLCINPCCMGHEGGQEDIACPLCGEKLYKAPSGFMCDGCGELSFGARYWMYDENFNKQPGLVQCEDCMFHRDKTDENL